MAFLDIKNIVECQTCGNRDGSRIVERSGGYVCKCCGVWYKSNPTEEEFREQMRCEQGYAQLRAYRFGDARDTFQIILQRNPKNINALWGLLLSRFGVVYIKGFYKGVVEPIYCFPNYERMKSRYVQNEPEFFKIMEILENDDELRFEYEKKAEKIDDALDNFKKYKTATDRDVFICVKISAATNSNPEAQGRTKDYEFALKVYNELKKRGVNAFYSFVTLQNDVKSDEKIWRNLVKSKKLLLIGSSEEYLESPWVKSEWKRWLHLKREEDMYVCVLHGENESPFDILPEEIAELEQQIYTQNDYQRLIEHICNGVDTVSYDFKEENEVIKREETLRAEEARKAEEERKAEEKISSEIPFDIQSNETKEYYKKAVSGDLNAQCNLGYCYKNGKGVEQNYKKAVYWFTKAAEKGDASAQYNLGCCYDNGEGVERDYAKAVYWYTKSSEQGDAEAQYNLGLCYYDGEGVALDYAKAVYWFTRAAEQGDAEAQYNLGCCYYKGEGVARDYTKAANWYMKAAEQGHENAQYNLGLCYDKGEGVVQDYTKAAYWITKAAEQGDADAQYSLGYCYDNGEGVVQNPTKAANWYMKAAEQGHISAQYNLGCCYENGEGVKRDPAKAVYWYTKAAEQGDADSQTSLGVILGSGQGVKRDPAKAVYWFAKAAEQGDEMAQYGLGMCYEEGDGVSQDYYKAVEWYTKAAEQGDKDAKKALRRLRKYVRK